MIFAVGGWIRDSSKKEAARLKRDTCQHYGRRSGSCIKYDVICCSVCKRWEQKRDRPRRKGKEKSYIKRLSDKLLGDNETLGDEENMETITGIDRFQWILRKCNAGEKIKIIDIGSQDGHTFKNTEFSGYVTSVDIDKYDFPGFIQMDANKLEFPDKTFDIAILGEILEHVISPVMVLKEADRVAKRVLITVPNEYEWDKSLFPFQTIEEDSKRTNRTIEQMAKDGNPEAIEFNAEDGCRHLWHRRYYEEDSLRKDLEDTGIVNYRMEKLNYGGWAFFTVDTNAGNAKQETVTDAVWKEVGTSVDNSDRAGARELCEAIARVGGPNITYGTDVNMAKIISSKGKLRIALISTPFFGVPPLKYGGLEQIVWDLAEGLDELGHIVTIFAPEGSKTPKHGMLVTTGPAIDTVGVNWFAEEEKRYFKWKDVITNDRYDIVHDHSWFGFPYFHRMNNLKLRVLHTHHGGYTWDTAPPFPKPNLVAISKWMKLYTEQYFKQKGFNIECEYVYNGVDLEKYSFDSSVKKTDRLLYVGRFSRFKQPDMTIRVAKAVGIPIDLIGGTFVDDIGYLKEIESMCDGENVVMYKDASHEFKIKKLQEAKALIVPSKMNEPFGLTCIEGMACGTPVIASKDGAIPEIVIDGVTGFVCDNEQKMVDAVSKVDTIKSSDCRTRAEEFSKRVMAMRYEVLYKRIINGQDW